MTLLPIDDRRINTRFFSFTPVRSTEQVMGARFNPLDDFTGDNYAARLFVGFNVDQKATWRLDDLMGLVRELRAAQGQRPDATYIATRGMFTHKSGTVVEEDGGQVVVFAVDEDAQTFMKNMGDVAEAVVRAFDQEEVFLEIQKNGIQVKLLRARP